MDLASCKTLASIEEVWRRLDVDARTKLCRVSCYYKRVYLHSAFQILQLKTPKKEWGAFLEHEVTRDLDFGCWDFRLVGASPTSARGRTLPGSCWRDASAIRKTC